MNIKMKKGTQAILDKLCEVLSLTREKVIDMAITEYALAVIQLHRNELHDENKKED